MLSPVVVLKKLSAEIPVFSGIKSNVATLQLFIISAVSV